MQADIRYIGLFDFKDINELANSLSDFLDLDLNIIYEKLFNEALSCGYNVRESATNMGIIFHEFNDKMIEFYKNTNAFLFELSVIHMHPDTKAIDLEIVVLIKQEYLNKIDIEILLLGDGVGTDSMRFAEMGYKTTYFEYESYSSKFAKYRFNRRGLDSKINIVHEPAEIKKNRYDIVICREVLEHVPDPLNIISDIWKYLNNNGLAIITESFGRVEDNFPTHLASNSKYDGKTGELFINEGFRIHESYKGNRLFIFRKVSKDDSDRFDDLFKEEQYILRDAIRKFGKKVIKNIRF